MPIEFTTSSGHEPEPKPPTEPKPAVTFAMPQITSFTWPARIDVEVRPKGPADTELTVHGSITGVGPIQSNHLKGQVGRFLNSLSVLIDTSSTRQATPPEAKPVAGLAAELRDLAELHSAGVLSDTEFEAAKAKLLGRG